MSSVSMSILDILVACNEMNELEYTNEIIHVLRAAVEFGNLIRGKYVH